MSEDKGRAGGYPPEQPPDDMTEAEPSKGTGLIFVLIALALILAIGFFYMTKDREAEPGKVLTEAAESTDSAARVVGDAAENAADRFGRK